MRNVPIFCYLLRDISTLSKKTSVHYKHYSSPHATTKCDLLCELYLMQPSLSIFGLACMFCPFLFDVFLVNIADLFMEHFCVYISIKFLIFHLVD